MVVGVVGDLAALGPDPRVGVRETGLVDAEVEEGGRRPGAVEDAEDRDGVGARAVVEGQVDRAAGALLQRALQVLGARRLLGRDRRLGAAGRLRLARGRLGFGFAGTVGLRWAGRSGGLRRGGDLRGGLGPSVSAWPSGSPPWRAASAWPPSSAGLEVLSSAGVGTADGDPISWPTIVLRAEESRPTTTPIVIEAKRTRTSRRTARRMITTRRQRGGGARRTLSARSNYLAIMCIPQAASRSDADESPSRFGCVTDCSPSARCIDRLTIGRPGGDHDGCGGRPGLRAAGRRVGHGPPLAGPQLGQSTVEGQRCPEQTLGESGREIGVARCGPDRRSRSPCRAARPCRSGS